MQSGTSGSPHSPLAHRPLLSLTALSSGSPRSPLAHRALLSLTALSSRSPRSPLAQRPLLWLTALSSHSLCYPIYPKPQLHPSEGTSIHRSLLSSATRVLVGTISCQSQVWISLPNHKDEIALDETPLSYVGERYCGQVVRVPFIGTEGPGFKAACVWPDFLTTLYMFIQSAGKRSGTQLQLHHVRYNSSL